MAKKIFLLLQYLLPQYFLSVLIGQLMEIRLPWVKNFIIRQFIKVYKINLKEAIIEDPLAYPTFNDFFIRQLKPEKRPISQGIKEIISPVDGTIMQLGKIEKNQLLQVKGIHFNLDTLLGNDTSLAQSFYDGSFATFYLAPFNYHRVHMPLTGVLQKSIYVPGKLFSVNHITSQYIPQLYSRNERLITLFNTEVGSVAIILVAAMIVGGIQTVWMKRPLREKKLRTEIFSHQISLIKGAELGYFKMGSTVILLYEKDKITWTPSWQPGSLIQLGKTLGLSLS